MMLRIGSAIQVLEEMAGEGEETEARRRIAMSIRTFSHRPQPSLPSAAPRFAVQRFIQPRLTAGPVGDPFERERSEADEGLEEQEAEAFGLERVKHSLVPTLPPRAPGESDPSPPVPRNGSLGSRILRQELAWQPVPKPREPTGEALHSAAAEGVRTPAVTLPFLDRLQASFGRHSIGHVKAHVGPEAAKASRAMNALAFANGDHVVFGGTPDLRTAAHEAAHIVQQRAGVQLVGGIGREGDAYERHADTVADVVVTGRSAEGLLEQIAAAPKVGGQDGGTVNVIQRLVGIDSDGIRHWYDNPDDLREAAFEQAGANALSIESLAKQTNDGVTHRYSSWQSAFEATEVTSAHRRPSIGTINAFFERNTTPRPPIGQQGMNVELFEQNEKSYYQEFKERVLRLRAVEESQILRLWSLMIECFRRKDPALAEEFLRVAEEKIGLKPLRAEGARIFWSGTASREHAYAISSPAGATALEKTDIGQLLDKLSFFKVVPWELSTILWALVSRNFGMGATGDMHVYLDGGFAKGNVFWNDELPMLRLMQRYGTVQKIIMHIWHTRDKRWLPEFNIDSDDLRLVFDKAKRIPAPTPENAQATRSFRYDKPIRVSALRGAFERFLQSPSRQHPLVFYEFRKKTGVYARAQKEVYGLHITLYEYGDDATKTIKVLADPPEKAFDKLPEIEEHLIEKFQDFDELPVGQTF